jgi:hypothetical protein
VGGCGNEKERSCSNRSEGRFQLRTVGVFHVCPRTRARGGQSREDSERLRRRHGAQGGRLRRFTERNGTIVCRDLLGCDISTQEGFERAKQQGLFDTVCTKLVKDSVEILEDMLSK